MTGVPMACKVCRQPLNQFTDRFGEVEYVHTRMWEEPPDHASVPVPAHTLRGDYVCDYCLLPNPRWTHWGADIELPSGSTAGSRWAACVICNNFVRHGNLQGLLRHIDAQPANQEHMRERPELRTWTLEQRYVLPATFVPTIRRRTPMPDPDKPPRVAAGEMVKVRNQLASYWTSELFLRGVASQAAEEPGGLLLPGYAFDNPDKFQVRFPMVSREGLEEFGRRQAIGIQAGNLYWISGEFTALAVRAGRQMKDTSFAREDLPSTNGLIYFDAPIMEKKISNIGEDHPLAKNAIPLQAISWVLVPGGIWITVYSLTDNVYQGDPLMREGMGTLTPWSPGAGFRYGDADMTDVPSTATLLATWAIMQQERFAAVSEHKQPASRAQAKKARKQPSEAPGATNTGVQVVDIRRRQRTASERAALLTTAKGSRGPIDYQMERAGHFKMQPYGKGRELRKRIYVDSYWVGDEDAPVRFKGEKVETLR